MNNQNVTNMTEGKPLKLILQFAIPLFIGNLFQQLYNMVDAVIVGNFVDDDALAAVGTCGSTNFMFFSLSLGLATGIGIIVSQYFGANKEDMVKKTIGNAIYVLLTASIIISIIGIVFAPSLLRLLSTPEDIMGRATTYMRTTFAGLICIAAYNGVASILRALGDSKTPLYFLIVSCILNVFLDILFVLGFHLDVFGVAIATIISQTVSAVSCTCYAYHKVSYFHLTKEQFKPDRNIISKSFFLGVPIALQSSLIALSCMVLQGVVNGFGKRVMSAYTIIGRIEQIVQQPFTSIGVALTSFTGQNVGARKMERVREGFHKAIWVVLIYSILMIPVSFFFGKSIVGIFTKNQEVIEISTKALLIDSVCYFPLAMIYVPRAVLNGAGDNRFAMINGCTEVACRIGYSYIFTNIPALGYWGIWVTTGVTWITTAIVCVARYMSKGWRRKLDF